MGDWRDNKDIEIPLDGVGGVSIVVKADVHREGSSQFPNSPLWLPVLTFLLLQASTSPPTPSRTKPRQKVSQRWPTAQASKSSACLITSYGTETPTRSPGTLKEKAALNWEENGFLSVYVFVSHRSHFLIAWLCFCLRLLLAIKTSPFLPKRRLTLTAFSTAESAVVVFVLVGSASSSSNGFRPAAFCCLMDTEFRVSVEEFLGVNYMNVPWSVEWEHGTFWE